MGIIQKVVALEGNRQKLDGGAMFGHAPKALWSRWCHVDAQNRVELACRCLLIQTAELNILCETGIGAFWEPKMAARYGVASPQRHILVESLAAQGLQSEDIDVIVLSHLHFDHAGGLLPTYAEIQAGGWHLQFPRAQVIVSAAAWERACHPVARDRASFIPELVTLLRESGRLHILNDLVQQPIPGVQVEWQITEGHTVGHLHSLWNFVGQKIFFAGDLVPGVAWLNPALAMGYDRFAEQLVEEKTHILSQLAREEVYLFYTHDPEVAFSQCAVSQGKFVASDPRPGGLFAI
ncbi:MAG: MBL fold metallo-hydrolase [Zetaproteobacteria bacterium]|nr:MBL fold metallo-hydrolase [Zetaproteobacteria bacterium]